MKNFKILGYVLILFSIPLTTLSEIRVGALFRFEDNYNTFVREMYLGAQYALSTSKLKNNVTLLKYNHDGTYQSLIKAYKRMIKENVNVIFGPETSSDAILLSKITEKKLIPIISPSASSSKMFVYNKLFFRISHPDTVLHKVVPYVLKRLKKNRINIFHNISKANNDAVSINIRKELTNKKIPFKVLEVLSDSILTKDELSPFLNNDTNLISMFTFESDLRKLFEILRHSEKPFIYIGADGWGRNEAVYKRYVENEKNKNLFTGIRMMYHDNSRKDSFYLKTVSEIRKISGKVGAFHMIGYDSMKVILTALKNKKKFVLKEFVSSMKSNKFTNLLTSYDPLTFNGENAAVKDINLYKIDKDGIKFWGVVK